MLHAADDMYLYPSTAPSGDVEHKLGIVEESWSERTHESAESGGDTVSTGGPEEAAQAMEDKPREDAKSGKEKEEVTVRALPKDAKDNQHFFLTFGTTSLPKAAWLHNVQDSKKEDRSKVKQKDEKDKDKDKGRAKDEKEKERRKRSTVCGKGTWYCHPAIETGSWNPWRSRDRDRSSSQRKRKASPGRAQKKRWPCICVRQDVWRARGIGESNLFKGIAFQTTKVRAGSKQAAEDKEGRTEIPRRVL
eukprot:g4123.t1